ncbi:apolipoprotein N-acyltransferase [candidate division KSB1 bacterium]|nr:apolipoprotein N-acyltransferase [candidate division KSB1 bacterium]
MKKNSVLCLITGIIIALSLPPFRFGFLGYVALIPFFLLLENKAIGEAFRWGYITGFCIAVTSLFWIGWVTVPGLFGVLLVWPLFIALYAILHALLFKIHSRFAYVLLPFVWTMVEYLQSHTELAFPWIYLGYTQSYFLPLIQYAEITSIYGVSFWVVLINVLFYLLWRKSPTLKLAIALLAAILVLFLVPSIHGIIVLKNIKKGESLKISLIQGNRDPNEKWNGDIRESNFAIYARMTRQVLDDQPDLVVWPETAMPFYLRSERDYLQKIHELIDSTNTYLLTGAIDYEFLENGSYEHFNSAMMIEPHYYTMQRYAKMKLVPFSEKVPYKNYFPFNVLKDLLWDLGLGDYALGGEIGVLEGRFRSTMNGSVHTPNSQESYDYQTAVAICYESVFPNHVRQYVNKGADFLIIITNDAWFGKTSGPFQHAQMAVFRAIENRRDIARCANTGISCFISKYGAVRQATPLFEPAMITDSVKLNEEKTFYTQHGDVFAVFVTFVSILSLVIALIKKVVLL